MDQRSSTAEVSVASKSISRNYEPKNPILPDTCPSGGSVTGFSDKSSSYDKGLAAEKLVQSYFAKQNFDLRHHRLRTPFAEVDLVLQCLHRRKILLVEVKLSDAIDFHRHLLTMRQRTRLRRAAQWYTEQVSDKGLDVQLLLAIVSRTGQIQFFFDAFI